MRAGRFVFVLLMLVVAVTGACSRGGDDDANSGDVQVEIDVSPDPPEMGPAVITVRLTDPDGEPIDDADLEIEGNMSHAGMEPVIVDAPEDQDGRYVSDGFQFTMGGDWIITVSGTLPDGEEFERTFDLEGVSS
ncbi:MAG: FixH family protein [Thermomicrobiales bacterium]